MDWSKKLLSLKGERMNESFRIVRRRIPVQCNIEM